MDGGHFDFKDIFRDDCRLDREGFIGSKKCDDYAPDEYWNRELGTAFLHDKKR